MQQSQLPTIEGYLSPKLVRYPQKQEIANKQCLSDTPSPAIGQKCNQLMDGLIIEFVMGIMKKLSTTLYIKGTKNKQK